MNFDTEEQLLKYTNNIIGKTFEELDINKKLDSSCKDKGILGKIVETGFYKYPNNNFAKADFDKLGIELKVTGYVKKKNGMISAKERIVLGKINYNEIINDDFNFSKLLFKNKKILIIWYEYDYKKEYKDFVITNYQLYDMSNDELIIKNDFEIIKEKVVTGNAHLLSEGDTSYLGACIKGVNGDKRVSQPNNKAKMAKPRAFSLKHSYLNGILKQSEFALEVDNSEYKTVEEYVFAQIQKYIGKTQLDIYWELMNERYSFDQVPKNIGKMISDKLIGKDNELKDKNALFSKTTFTIKNIPVDKNLYPLERLSFRTIKLNEFDINWDDSEWKNYFEEVTIIAICYEGTKEIANGLRILKDIKKITFSADDIDSFKKSYEMIQEAILSKDITLLPYPGSYENQILEVAPKGQKGVNAYANFFNENNTHVCFMLNKEFVYQKLTDNNNNTGNNKIDNKNNNITIENNNNYNIFKLYEYGINMSLIKNLADKRVSPYNIYLNGIRTLNFLNTSTNKKEKIYQSCIDIIKKSDFSRTIYELLYQNISKSLCDNLTNNNITIDIIRNTSSKELKEKYNIGTTIAARIKDSINNNDIVIAESNNNINTYQILGNILKEVTINGPISYFDFKYKACNNPIYISSNFENDYSKLQENNKIKNSMYGIEYNFLSVKDYIKNILSDKDYQIFTRHVNGETLQSISNYYNLTRERIRQIELKAYRKLNFEAIKDFFIEDKYKDIYEKYEWTSELFCKIFSLDLMSYVYLKKKYIRGNEALHNIINDDYFTDAQKQIYKNNSKIVVAQDGTIIHNSNDFLKKLCIKYCKDELSIDKFTQIYNEEITLYPELELEKTTERNIEAKLSRTDYIIFGSNHLIRYYDFSKLTDEAYNELKELIILNDGFYSTEFIFKNNEKVMKELDIRNEYELHNILRWKIDDDKNNIHFLRMPNFLIEYKDKDEFILDKIKEYSPISLSDFIDILHEDYGHKKQTMLSYLTSFFVEYIKDGILNSDSKKLSDEELNKLNGKFTNDIYPIEIVKSILISNGFTNPDEFLTNYNFLKLGYRLKSGFIIKAKFNGVYNYLDSVIKNTPILKFDSELLHCGSICNALNYYCSELEIFKVSDFAYITISRLTELGIDKNYILNFVDKVKSKFSDKDYFSVKNIINELDVSKFTNLGLTEYFIDNILFHINELKTLRINNCRLYTLNSKNVSINNFMYDMANKYGSISLDQLENEISKNYQVKIPVDKLKGYLYETDIFYSNILDKIYSDKNDYYEEVYNE